ncbi:hypothetical protein VCV18_002164 [Metarhizium anisopliae]
MPGLSMDELSHGLCPHPGCGTHYDNRCRICVPPDFCEVHTPERDKQRHGRFCATIRQQRTLHEQLRREADQPIQTRSGVCADLADATYALVDLLFQAFYPGPLPATTYSDISKLLNDEKIKLFWSDDFAKFAAPALYIFQDKDQEAYARAMLLMTSAFQRDHRASGPPPRISSRQIAVYSMLAEASAYIIRLDQWVYRVPLALLKLRLVRELRYLLQHPQELERLREISLHEQGTICLREGGPTRSFMKQLVLTGDLALQIISLENEIRALARFERWKVFWRYMCYPEGCAWLRQNSTGGLTRVMWMCLHVNHYSWVATPGACTDMINLLELWEGMH